MAQMYNEEYPSDVKDTSFVRRILNDHRENLGKLFIGGLNREVTDDDIRAVFSQYGNVTDCVAIKNKETGGNRGFGFVSFDDVESVNAVMNDFTGGGIEIRGKKVDIKRAVPKDVPNPESAQTRTKKCFVGGISQNLTSDDLKEYFEAFPGVKVDKLDFKGKFAFVEFASENDADLLSIICKHTPVKQGNRPFEVKKSDTGDSGGRGGGRGGGFGRGGRGGGFGRGSGGGGFGRGGGGGYGGASSYDSGFAYDSFGGPQASQAPSGYGGGATYDNGYGAYGSTGGGYAAPQASGYDAASNGYSQGYGGGFSSGSGGNMGSYGQETSSFGPSRGGRGGGRGAGGGFRGRTRPY